MACMEIDKVLCVGLACVDFINVTRQYPQEDTDHRGTRYYWQRGGNASNNCTVLSLMSIPVEFMGVLGDSGAEARFIQEDFNKMGIDTKHCVIEKCECPVSTCILSEVTGSRTILHYPRDQPKLTYTDFHDKLQGDFSQYSVVHFELGSNISDYGQMMDDVLQYRKTVGFDKTQRPLISLEVEKPEIQNAEKLMAKADLVFISKDFAKFHHITDPTSAVQELYRFCHSGSILICAWDDSGAAAFVNNEVVMATALTDIHVVDTLGAGDTFIAGFIGHALRNGFIGSLDQKMVQECLQYGCHLAGRKCSMYGYMGLKEFI